VAPSMFFGVLLFRVRVNNNGRVRRNASLNSGTAYKGMKFDNRAKSEMKITHQLRGYRKCKRENRLLPVSFIRASMIPV
jgi:hypothetical protein